MEALQDKTLYDNSDHHRRVFWNSVTPGPALISGLSWMIACKVGLFKSVAYKRWCRKNNLDIMVDVCSCFGLGIALVYKVWVKHYPVTLRDIVFDHATPTKIEKIQSKCIVMHAYGASMYYRKPIRVEPWKRYIPFSKLAPCFWMPNVNKLEFHCWWATSSMPKKLKWWVNVWYIVQWILIAHMHECLIIALSDMQAPCTAAVWIRYMYNHVHHSEGLFHSRLTSIGDDTRMIWTRQNLARTWTIWITCMHLLVRLMNF